MFKSKQQSVAAEDGGEEKEGSPKFKLNPSLLLIQDSGPHHQQPGGIMTLRRRDVSCQQPALPNERDELTTTSLSPIHLETTYLPTSSKQVVVVDRFKQNNSNKWPTNFLPPPKRSNHSKLVEQPLPSTLTKLQDDDDDDNNKSTAQSPVGSRIFSITTSLLLFVTILSLLGIICLSICNKQTLLVSAQYPNLASLQHNNNNNQQHHHQHHNHYPDQQQQQQQPNSNSGRLYQQASSSSASPSYQHQPTSSPDEARRKGSIDRFDSGEQIRAPLIRQPTTLPPLTTTATRQSSHHSQPQASSSSSQQQPDEQSFNLHAAASQDSYLSPEDREQLLRSQESHYEGKGYDQQQTGGASGPVDSDRGDAAGYERSDRWNSPDGASNRANNNLESQSSNGGRPEQAPAVGADRSQETDEGDYDDENPEADQKNLVPENRRMAPAQTGSASYNRQQQMRQFNRRPAATTAEAAENADESDPSEDYDGANDDTLFSRKSNHNLRQQDPQQNHHLSSAASHNRNNNNHHQGNIKSSSLANRQSSNYDGRPTNNGADSSGSEEDSQGFGPGPNEAYMADRAESSSELNRDDDEALADASSNLNEDDGNRFDKQRQQQRQQASTSDGAGSNRRRQTEGQTSDSNNMPAASPPSNYESGGSGGGDGAESGEPNEDDSGVDGDASSEDQPPGSAFAPSSKSSVQSTPMNYPSPNQQYTIGSSHAAMMAPRISAATPTPLSASVGPLNSSPPRSAYSLPLSVTIPSSNVAMTATNHESIQPWQQVQAHQQQQHHLHQRIVAATEAPYNPQNNPSHAGKYFIN